MVAMVVVVVMVMITLVTTPATMSITAFNNNWSRSRRVKAVEAAAVVVSNGVMTQRTSRLLFQLLGCSLSLRFRGLSSRGKWLEPV